MFNADVTIIGAGIIGLAIAMEMRSRFPSLNIVVLEKEKCVGTHQSGHNSGVIHSGIYYAPKSSKAMLCREGYDLLLAFCQQHGIRYEICGKIVVATDESELPRLHTLRKRGVENGLSGVRILRAEQVRELEPNAASIAALYVPQTGITDYKMVTRKLAEIFVKAGGDIRLTTRVTGISTNRNETVVKTTSGEFNTTWLINAAGLYSDTIGRTAGLAAEVSIVPFRGEYYHIKSTRNDLVRNLIYPVPDPELPFLGVHFTRRIDGGIEAGPNAVLAFKREGYKNTDFDAAELFQTLKAPGFWKMSARFWQIGVAEMRRSFSKKAFCSSLQRLVPQLQESDLEEAGSGVRAQAVNRKGELLNDFHIVAGVRSIHILNVPSPAATASLAIAKYVVTTAQRTFGLSNREYVAVH